MHRHKLFVIALIILITFMATEILFGWPWSTDMFFQPSVKTFEREPMAPPEGTLPIDGEPQMDRIKMGELYRNPIEATPESLERGKALFETFCAVCHNYDAKGGGPVAAKFIPPPDLTLDHYRKLSDGYIYGTIRNGSVLMPPQGAALYPKERWDVVNYLRSLQEQ